MKIITFENIKKMSISPKMCFDWALDVMKQKYENVLPPKLSMHSDIEGVFFNTMPSIVNPIDRIGVKLVNRYPHRFPSLDSQIMLYDNSTGNVLALMDGNWITAMRTGAVAANSIEILGIKNYSKLGIIGLGNVSRATLLVLLAIHPEREFEIRLKKYNHQEESFIERFGNYSNIKFICCDSYEEVVSNSQVVISGITYTENDLCSDECFKEGVLVVPIHTRGFTNCDLFFDKVFCDDVGHVSNFKNFSKFKSLSELSEVVTNKKQGRTNDKERIIAYNIGISIQDIYFANKVYEMSENCQEFSLQAPTEKFWV